MVSSSGASSKPLSSTSSSSSSPGSSETSSSCVSSSTVDSSSSPWGVSDGVSGWGRAIFYVSDVDAMHARVEAVGYTPDFAPRDAPWGERFFHVTDPDGHEISFAKPL